MENFRSLLELTVKQEVKKKLFYISERTEFNYEHLNNRIKKIGALVNSFNMKQGDRILVSISNDYDMFCVTLGLIVHGLTAVLIDPTAKASRAKIITSAANIDGWVVDKHNSIEWGLPEVSFGVAIEEGVEKKGLLLNKLLNKKEVDERQTLDSLLASIEPAGSLPDLLPEQPALIIFTSGTTSDQKGVILNHGNLLAHLATLSKQYELNGTSVISNVLPSYHVDGLIQGTLLTFYNRITLSRPFPFEIPRIEDFLYSIYKYRVSHFFTVPTMLTLIKKFGSEWSDSFKTPDFKFVISSAGYLDENLWRNFMEIFGVKILNVYGLTESVAGGLFCGPSVDCWRIGSIGKPVDSEAKIIDDQGMSLPENQMGEITIRGSHIMSSYLTPSGNPDENGWFRTGDLGYKDSDGFYYIKGRLKNVIVKGGINIYPEEIIETLNSNPEIEDAFVFGEKDDTWGEVINLVIKKSLVAGLNEKDVLAFCKLHLEKHKIPDRIYFMDELPRGLSGKVMIDQVKLAVQRLSTAKEMAIVTDESIQKKLLKIASDSFSCKMTTDHLASSSQAIDGWNSLGHLDFATNIEKVFGIELSTQDIMNIKSISAAESIVANKLKKNK